MGKNKQDQNLEIFVEEQSVSTPTVKQKAHPDEIKHNFYLAIKQNLIQLNNPKVCFAEGHHASADNIIQHYSDEYRQNRNPLRELGKWLFSIVTFGLGALRFLDTTVVLQPDQIQVKKDFRGNYIILPPGRHSLFPWESYVGPVQTVRSDRLELGNEVVVRVKQGELGSVIERETSNIKLLEPGTYIFNQNDYVIEQPKSITNMVNQSTTSFGGPDGVEILVVKGDEVAAVSNKITGENEVLEQGVYLTLKSDSQFYGPKPRNHDVIRLGPFQIVTARAGFAGIYYHKDQDQKAALDIIEAGNVKILDLSKGERFHHLMNTQVRSEEVTVDHAVTSDGYEFAVKANITYQVENVKVAAQKIDNVSESVNVQGVNTQQDQIKEEVHQFAKRIISEIILKHSRRDLQPFSAEMEFSTPTPQGSGKKGEDTEERHSNDLFEVQDDSVEKAEESKPKISSQAELKKIGMEIKSKLKSTLEEWGVSLHQDIEITDLTMIDPLQKQRFNEQVNKIQDEIFQNEAERRKRDRMHVQNQNLLETARAQAEAEKVKERVKIDAIREALTKVGMSEQDIKEYLMKQQFFTMLKDAKSVVPVPIDMHGFFKMGKTVEGEVYRVNTSEQKGTDSASELMQTTSMQKQLAMMQTMDSGASTSQLPEQTQTFN